MGSSPLRANKSGLVPLATHLDFDIKGILALNTRCGLSLAQHTVRRLLDMEAPEWAFKKLISDCFLKLPELNAGWIIQAQARDFFKLLTMCAAKVSDNALRGEVILIARRFRDYNLLKAAVAALANRPLSHFEFREAADLLMISSKEFSETASLICLDAYKAHGLDFRNQIKAILKKKHGEWIDVEIEDGAIPV